MQDIKLGISPTCKVHVRSRYVAPAESSLSEVALAPHWTASAVAWGATIGSEADNTASNHHGHPPPSRGRVWPYRSPPPRRSAWDVAGAGR